MKKTSASWLAVVCALSAGCAGTPKLPPQFDLGRATIVAGAADPVLVLDGASGKGQGAALGAAKGGGAGLGVGALACLGAGPLAPLCLAVVVPTTLAIGAAGGAVVGAVRAESADGVQAKASVLEGVLNAPGARQRLAHQVQRQAREGLAVALPLADEAPGAVESGWTLRITMTELASVGSGTDVPYALRASASLEIERSQAAQTSFVRHYQALSPLKLTTAQWQANDAEPVRTTLEGLLSTLAVEIVNDLRPRDSPRGPSLPK